MAKNALKEITYWSVSSSVGNSLFFERSGTLFCGWNVTILSGEPGSEITSLDIVFRSNSVFIFKVLLLVLLPWLGCVEFKLVFIWLNLLLMVAWLFSWVIVAGSVVRSIDIEDPRLASFFSFWTDFKSWRLWTARLRIGVPF